MSIKWEKFEEDCFGYLCKEFGENIEINAYGKSDSTKADVELTVTPDNSFFVEIKENKSQCCQFVVFPNEASKSFDVSADVKSPDTNNRRAIVEYMNDNYETFCAVNTTGISINIDSEVLYGWVNDFYKPKNVRFFMTKGNEYIITPIENFSELFNISAVYRIKKSGSANPNQRNNLTEIEEGFHREGLLGQLEFIKVGKKYKCFFHSKSNNNEKSIVCNEYTYLLKENKYSAKISKKENFVYEVRRLSNTANPNVICELSLKYRNQKPNDLAEFKRAINMEE